MCYFCPWHHTPMHALRCSQMCAQSDRTGNWCGRRLMPFTLCSFLIPVSNFALQNHSNLSVAVVLNALLQHVRLLTVPSCACILKRSLLCPASAEQAPSQFPIQYTHKGTSVLSRKSYSVISRLSWLRWLCKWHYSYRMFRLVAFEVAGFAAGVCLPRA